MANRLNQFNPVVGGNDLLDGSGNFLTDELPTLIDTTTAVVSSLNPSISGNSVIFTATVTPASGVIVPTGTVAFMDLVTMIGTGTLSAGATTLTTSALSVGAHNITAVYGGDGTYNGSTSSILTQTVYALTPPPSGGADVPGQRRNPRGQVHFPDGWHFVR